MANTDDQDQTDQELKDRRFVAYLEWAHKEVSTWPEWKRNLLGGYPGSHKPAQSDRD